MAIGPGTLVTEKVSLVRLMREGSMGQVWLAKHETLHTEIVVKFISEELLETRPDARGRFEREASATARIKSPHVIQIFDYGEMDDGTPYMVMELLEGESLGDRIDREGQLTAADTAEMIRQVGNALDLAHGNGIIHRDIKPQNINLRHVHGALHVKVLDFGIAKQTLADEDAGLTMPGMVVGTLEYLSREMVSGQGKVDFRLDLWALAVVAYKALTGKVPFSGDGMVQIVKAIREGKFRRPSAVRPELPTAIDNWFIRAFHPDEDKRFTSAAQMARAYKEALEETASAGVYETTAQREDRRAPRWLLPAAGGVGVLALVATIIGIAASDDDDLAVDPPGAVGSAGTASAGTSSGPLPSTAAPSASSAAPAGTADPSLASKPSARAQVSMVHVPAGEFWMGCAEGKGPTCVANMKPGRTVYVDDFHLDKTEVTTAAYQACVEAGACTDRQLGGYQRRGGAWVFSTDCNWGQQERAQHPINCVTYHQATAYCRWADKRLPTEAEWEKAARGDKGTAFPWGDEPPSCDQTVMNAGKAGCGELTSWPVGQKPADVSPHGALDMVGNVREWVADWYSHHYYASGPAKNPPGPETGVLRVARGGSWGDARAELLRVSTRAAYLPHARAPFMGFRCARSAD